MKEKGALNKARERQETKMVNKLPDPSVKENLIMQAAHDRGTRNSGRQS